MIRRLWRQFFPDKFRLDVNRVVMIDGKEFVIHHFFTADSVEITVVFMRLDRWMEQHGT